MKNSYKVIVKAHQGADKPITHDVPAPGSLWGALKIKAAPGARYQLVDNATGQGPDNIRVKRTGNDLRISFEGRDDADVVIANYYEQTEPGFGAVIGETDPDVYYAYMPESGETAALMGNLPDGASQVGMALGGEQVVASGAAVGALVAAAGFNPLLAAPLALLGAGGGGGGGGAADTTPPKVTAAKLMPDDDTGVSASDGITSDNTPRLLIDADADATEVTVTLNGKTYTSTTKNAQGQFVVQVTDADALGNGVHPFTAVAKDAAGNASTPLNGSFAVDRSGTDNYVPVAAPDANQGVTVQITAITDDTGFSATDFITSDNTLAFQGTLSSYVANGQNWVELHLLKDGAVVASQYVQPSNTNGVWQWSWDNSAQKLADGPYQLTAQVVDSAGNVVGGALVSKDIVIDTNAVPEAQASFPLAITQLVQDSGASASDFLTNQQQLAFTGNVGTTNAGFSGYKVLVQVLGTDGQIRSQAYVDPSSTGAWSYDNTSQTLGVTGANTPYVLKASVVDLSGNVLQSTSQSFVVDLQHPVVGYSSTGGSSGTNGEQTFTSISFNSSEKGEFSSGAFVVPTSSSLQLIGATFAPGAFTLNFTDLAGNSSGVSGSLTNSGQTWKFLNTSATLVQGPSAGDFIDLTQSVGKYSLGMNQDVLDLTSLYDTTPKISDIAAINHVSMVGGVDSVITVSTDDVLALGVKNSFTNSGHLQIRIDGDVADKVLLDDLVGGSTFAWDKAAATVALSVGQNYVVYSNATLGLDLFIQQGIQVTAVL